MRRKDTEQAISDIRVRLQERMDSRKTAEDGGAGSGNWGHAGRPGSRGGSTSGGGKAHRMGTAAGGFTSAAKERAKAKTTGGGSSGGGSTSGGGEPFSSKALKKKKLKDISVEDTKALYRQIESRHKAARKEYLAAEKAAEEEIAAQVTSKTMPHEKFQIQRKAYGKANAIAQRYVNESWEDFELARKIGNAWKKVQPGAADVLSDIRNHDKFKQAHKDY